MRFLALLAYPFATVALGVLFWLISWFEPMFPLLYWREEHGMAIPYLSFFAGTGAAVALAIGVTTVLLGAVKHCRTSVPRTTAGILTIGASVPLGYGLLFVVWPLALPMNMFVGAVVTAFLARIGLVVATGRPSTSISAVAFGLVALAPGLWMLMDAFLHDVYVTWILATSLTIGLATGLFVQAALRPKDVQALETHPTSACNGARAAEID